MGNVINTDSAENQTHVLPSHMGGGPMNLGDPDDKTLRKVERDILVLNLVRKRMHEEKCHNEAETLDKCGGEAGLLVGFKCRKERDSLLDCSKKWFYDEDFRQECVEEYLRQRTYYRRTGKPGYLYKEDVAYSATI